MENSEKYREQWKRWYAVNRERLRAQNKESHQRHKVEHNATKCRWNLRMKYKMMVEQFNALLECQGNRCAICQTDHPRGLGSWKVDHDHKTGEVRGLLCNICNAGLGIFKDNISLLEAAIKYLQMASGGTPSLMI